MAGHPRPIPDLALSLPAAGQRTTRWRANRHSSGKPVPTIRRAVVPQTRQRLAFKILRRPYRRFDDRAKCKSPEVPCDRDHQMARRPVATTHREAAWTPPLREFLNSQEFTELCRNDKMSGEYLFSIP